MGVAAGKIVTLAVDTSDLAMRHRHSLTYKNPMSMARPADCLNIRRSTPSRHRQLLTIPKIRHFPGGNYFFLMRLIVGEIQISTISSHPAGRRESSTGPLGGGGGVDISASRYASTIWNLDTT